MDFEQLIAMLRNPGEDGIPETIYDDLSASYTDATSTRDAKISETSGAVEELTAELLRVKAMNYDLLIAAGVDNSEENGNDGDNTDDSEDSDDIGDDDDFFEKKED